MRGDLAPGDLARALALQARQSVRLGDILVKHGMVTEAQLMEALCVQYDTECADLTLTAPDARLIDSLGIRFCLSEALLPLRRLGGATVVATARPDEFERQKPGLTRCFGPVIMALVSEPALHAALLEVRRSAMTRRAESRVRPDESCRAWSSPLPRRGALLALVTVALMGALAPALLAALLLAWAAVTLMLVIGLRTGAAIAWLSAERASVQRNEAARPTRMAKLPRVSILVPMFREPDIAPRLIARLTRLSYPVELLDVLLIVEEDDALTRDALAATELPCWMRVIPVPGGTVKTKPRALNYALDFARGSIVGVFDAEDAPAPDQLHKVVRRFHESGDDLACVQGFLDYYNPATNWISRCFTIEYAAWFRVVLRGMQRLGLALPLGGTTFFVRRDILERVGAWDAHNVTEDADLGIRLARHGYRTEVVPTTTEEEPNCHVVPWVKQRSRWLKGFILSYAVQMRDPAAALRELGAWRLLGVQVVFLATVSQYLLAPLLWSFWLLALGLWHPFSGLIPQGAILALGALFLLAEVVNMSIAVIAVSGARHRFLRKWVPMLHLYFPLGAFAAYKAVWELLWRPFYWDKTTHGLYDTPAGASGDAAAQPVDCAATLPFPVRRPAASASRTPSRCGP